MGFLTESRENLYRRHPYLDRRIRRIRGPGRKSMVLFFFKFGVECAKRGERAWTDFFSGGRSNAIRVTLSGDFFFFRSFGFSGHKRSVFGGRLGDWAAGQQSQGQGQGDVFRF